MPEGAPHKGDAILQLRKLADADTALYVGDDFTDEDVFALDQPGRLLTVRIGDIAIFGRCLFSAPPGGDRYGAVQAVRVAREEAGPRMSNEGRHDYFLGPALDFLRRLWRLNHALEKHSSRMDQRLGVTAQQRLVIRCVGKYPGVTAGQLAALLHVDPGTASAALKRLEEKRMVERRRDPRDKRRVALGLTARGRQIDRPHGTVEQIAERLLAEVTTAEAAGVRTILERFTALLEASDATAARAPSLRDPGRSRRSRAGRAASRRPGGP